MGNQSSTLSVIKPALFRFNFSIYDYKFEFHVDEIDKASAQVHLRQMVDLYINGHARVARAKLEAGLGSKNAYKIIRIADVLSNYDFSDLDVAVEEDYLSYHARRLPDESALLCVVGHDGLEIDKLCLGVKDYDTYLKEALSQDSNYFRSLMSKIDCFNSDFYEQLPAPLYFNPKNAIKVYDPIMLKELSKRLLRDYKMAEIPENVFDSDKSYYKTRYESNVFIQVNNNFIFNNKHLFRITPLMVAAARLLKFHEVSESLESIKLILRDRTIDINQQDIFGRTALMHVVLRLYAYSTSDVPGKEAVTKLLLEHDADPLVTDVLGKNALDYFLEYCDENHPAYKLLLEKSNTLAAEPASFRL